MNSHGSHDRFTKAAGRPIFGGRKCFLHNLNDSTLIQKFSNSTNIGFVKLYWALFHKLLTAVNVEGEILPYFFSCKFTLQK